MRKNRMKPRIYSSNMQEKQMFETKKDAILSEGLGFYQFDPSVEEDFVDLDARGEDLGDESTLSFIGRKGKEKRKRRREERREKVKDFFERQKQNVKDFIKDPKKAIKKGIEEVGKGIKQGALAVPRSAFLSLLMLNYRGNATKINALTSKGASDLRKKWSKMGGQPSKLMDAAKRGANKKPFLCGGKCRASLKDLIKDKSNFDGYNMCGGGYMNVAGVDDAAVAAWVATASAVTAALAPIIKAGLDTAKNAKELKAIDEQLKAEKEAIKAEEARKDAAQKAEEELAAKALEAQLDPVQQIQANPNLSPEEKAEAIKQVEDALGRSMPKWLFPVAAALLLSAIGYVLIKKSK